MDDYAVLIPSYHRAEKQSTLDLIEGALAPSRIVIGTQCQEDFLAYSNRYGKRAVIVFKEGDSVGHNRNTLLEYCCKEGIRRAVMLDDDIKLFKLYDKTKVRTPVNVKILLDSCMDAAEKHKAVCWGTYPTDHPYMMKRKASCCMLTGTCMGIMDTKLRFDTAFRVKEDFELSLRVISGGGLSLRFNHFAPVADHKTQGGCERDWKSNVYIAYADMLVMRYPKLVTYSHKIGEIKMIKKK